MTRGARIAAVVCSAALASACGAAFPADGPSPHQRRAVVDGAADVAHEEVVAVVKDGALECSGVVIGPRVVLTAAHCLSKSGTLAVRVGPDVDGGVELPVSAAAAHRAELDVDLAVFALAVSAPVAAAVVSPRRLDDGLVGETVTVVGYGTTAPLVVETGGVRRASESVVTEVGPHLFRTEADPGNACGGDSGGPAFERLDDGTERILGIVHGGDPSTCGEASFTRVDGSGADLVRRALAETREGSVALGGRCLFDGHCEDGACATYADARVCAAACASADDCGAGATCAADDDGALRCFDDAPPACDPCATFAAACGADPEDCDLRVVVPAEPASCGGFGATGAAWALLGVLAPRRGARLRSRRVGGRAVRRARVLGTSMEEAACTHRLSRSSRPCSPPAASRVSPSTSPTTPTG